MATTIDATTPVVRLGKRMYALEHRTFQGKPQASLRPVVAVVDTDQDPPTVLGFEPDWDAKAGISGSPEDMAVFLDRLQAIVDARKTAPGKRPTKEAAPVA